MKIQPIDSTSPEYFEMVKTVPKSRLRRLFDFSSFLRGSVVADRSVAGELQCVKVKDGADEFEPNSVCLDKMVQNFIEESNDKQSAMTLAVTFKCGRHQNQCKCFNGSNCCSSDSSEDEFDSFNCFGSSNNHHNSSTDACDLLKSLVLCDTVSERNLLADAAKIVDKNKMYKRKDETSRKMVTDGLLAAGYDVSICKSRWEKTSTYPAGEYEYIDAVIEGERLIIDIDFRSEFEIARSTKSYKAVLQMLPHVFVGKADRLHKIITIVSDAAKQSLRKKGMPLPPWRRAEYVKAKWLSPHPRIPTTSVEKSNDEMTINPKSDAKDPILIDESEVIVAEEEGAQRGAKQWQPLEIKPKVSKSGGKVVGGLASVIEGK